MTILVSLEQRFGGSWAIVELPEGAQEARYTGDYETKVSASTRLTRRLNRSGGEQYSRVDIDILYAEIAQRKALAADGLILEHSGIVVRKTPYGNFYAGATIEEARRDQARAALVNYYKDFDYARMSDEFLVELAQWFLARGFDEITTKNAAILKMEESFDNIDLPQEVRRPVIDHFSRIDQPTLESYDAAHAIVRYCLNGVHPIALIKSAHAYKPHGFYEQAIDMLRDSQWEKQRREE